MKLKFFGATKTVTGSCFLLQTRNVKALIDCGLFQGEEKLVRKNFKPLPFKAKDIDFLLLTHAHIDHSGRIGQLYQEGFRGKIFSTAPTKDLSALMLFDSFRILKRRGQKLNEQLTFKEGDITKSLKLFQTIQYHKWQKPAEDFSFYFKDAGHILGSAIIEIEIREDSKKKRIVFSGDLGNPPVPLLKAVESVEQADYVIIESTYGNRLHESKKKRKDLLEDAIEEAVKKQGTLLIPSFVIERTQEILFELNSLVENSKVPKIAIFVDGELAAKATEVYKKYPGYFNKSAACLIKSGDDLFKFPGLKFTRTKQESLEINRTPPPKVIVVAAGMSQGGRVLHHELRYLSDPENIILFIGHQVRGTLGRKIADGQKKVEIFNNKVQIKAKIKKIFSYSAHADQKILLSWLKNIKKPIKKVFVVHGEKEAAETLCLKIQDLLGIEAQVPEFLEELEL